MIIRTIFSFLLIELASPCIRMQPLHKMRTNPCRNSQRPGGTHRCDNSESKKRNRQIYVQQRSQWMPCRDNELCPEHQRSTTNTTYYCESSGKRLKAYRL
ncbi:unnamed protein product, partial [Mesorhabditis belari]|uniref:Secreted protein n=1 Tax=Mesorhabditis belari TaxID=2138241 RepID=A0AAF3J3V9_9BILA